MVCRHLDGNPINNRLENLRWGTHKENKADAIKHGTAHDIGMESSKRTPELRRQLAKKANAAGLAKLSPEQHSENGKKEAKKHWANLTAEQRSERQRRVNAKLSPEQRREKANKCRIAAKAHRAKRRLDVALALENLSRE
jgi:hypothetical protein